jgi:PPOX class probable F420-dependent enzyme
VFAVVDDTIVHVVDAKPKSTSDPRRLTRTRNIQRDSRVAFLADWYDEDWSALWWVRADAVAVVLDRATDAGDWDRAFDALAARYPQYDAIRPTGAVIIARVTRWTGWSATE